MADDQPDSARAPEPGHDSGAEPPGAVPGVPGEPRGERVGRHIHRARLYTTAFAFIGLLVILVVLISVNTRDVKLSWAFGSTRASLVWIILVTAVLGWLLGITTAFAFRRRTRRRIEH
jgi:uncharacterized integral membrane protein